jgi:hypothetical protein
MRTQMDSALTTETTTNRYAYAPSMTSAAQFLTSFHSSTPPSPPSASPPMSAAFITRPLPLSGHKWGGVDGTGQDRAVLLPVSSTHSYRYFILTSVTDNRLSYPFSLRTHTGTHRDCSTRQSMKLGVHPKCIFLSQDVSSCLSTSVSPSILPLTVYLILISSPARLVAAVDSETDSLMSRLKRRQKLSAVSHWRRSPAPSKK